MIRLASIFQGYGFLLLARHAPGVGRLFGTTAER